MKKNYYIAPAIRNMACESDEMIAASSFSTDADEQKITLTDDETDVFTSRRKRFWDDED